jgi:hypothetical protein
MRPFQPIFKQNENVVTFRFVSIENQYPVFGAVSTF